MRRIYVSCTNRVESPRDAPQDRGEAYVIDWDTKKVIDRLDVFGPKDIRVGRSRGCAGIAWLNNKIYIACRSGLCVFDPDNLKLITEISEVGGGIHEIKRRGHKLYIVATDSDSFTVIENDEVIERVNIREKDLSYEALHYLNKYAGKKHVNCGANKLHFNSLAWDGNGDLHHVYMSGGLIYNWTRKKLVCEPLGKATMHHDLVLLENNSFLTNDSNSGETIVIDIATNTKRLVRKSSIGTQCSAPGGSRIGWLRGMALHKQTQTLFLTTAPGKLVMVNTNTWKDIDSMEFSIQPQEAPYGILLDPRDWRNEQTTEWLLKLGKSGSADE